MDEISLKDDMLFAKNCIQKEIRRRKKKFDKQAIELNESANWENYKKIADTILININLIKKGMTSIELLEETSQKSIKIELNTTLSAYENANLYYKRSRKGKRSYDICMEKINASKKEIIELEKSLEILNNFIDNGILGREREVEELINLYKKEEQKAKEKTTLQSHPFRHYNYKGYEIYLGKNSLDNDELSTKFANPSDIWFHAVGYSGSHLIIRRKKGDPMPPQEVLEVAGGIAVFFSKAKNTSYAEVHMTEARFVRKKRKSAAGLVTIERYKTIRVSPIDPQSLFKEIKTENHK